jgi:hypothetical protein
MKRLGLWVMIAATHAACAGLPGHLYPVQGPLAAHASAPIYDVRRAGSFKFGGAMSATLAGGEVCSGKWVPVSAGDPSASRMSTEWDSVYGQGFFVAHVLGSSELARADLVGTSGTALSVQMIDDKGVASDNKGNIFKLTF